LTLRLPSSASRALLEQQVQKYHSQVGEVVPYLTSRGLNQQAIDRFKIGYTGDTDNYSTRNRLAIPYLTPAGPWHIKYRCIEQHDCKEAKCKKYTYEGGQQQHMYNAAVLLDAERVVLVEGELDAISVSQCGVPAVAYPGAQTFRSNKHWRFCFDSCDEIIIVADGDPPDDKGMGVGEREATEVARTLRDSVPGDVDVVVLPQGHDSNSLIQQEGYEDFLLRINWL
jgi:DNA primase